MPLTRHPDAFRRRRDGTPRRRLYLRALAVAVFAAALVAIGFLFFPSGGGRGNPASWPSYEWPLKPFDKPHPIRGNFDDPRMPNHHINGPGPFSFHAGIDISAAGGTAVYAVAPGTVYVPGVAEAYLHGHPVALGVRGKGVRFEYWHIRPAIESGRRVATHQLLGYVIAKWGHVHLTEMWGGKPVNPLRAGGLTPYVDHTKPTIVSAKLYQNGTYIPLPATLSGRADLVLEAYDKPELTPNWPSAVVTPALIRWRLIGEATGKVVVPTQTTVDFRLYRPKASLADVFAPGTRQNGPKRGGVYNFWLVRGLDSSRLPNGSYKLVVLASDTKRNTARKAFELTVEN